MEYNFYPKAMHYPALCKIKFQDGLNKNWLMADDS